MQASIVFLVRVQCRRKESSRSLSHLLMSFLYLFYAYYNYNHSSTTQDLLPAEPAMLEYFFGQLVPLTGYRLFGETYTPPRTGAAPSLFAWKRRVTRLLLLKRICIIHAGKWPRVETGRQR